MNLAEPISTALLLTTFGLLMAVSVLFSRALERLGVPIVLLFLLLGMFAGSRFGIVFHDYGFAFRVGMVALVLILFDGGLNTPLAAVRQGIRPAGLLATVGVIGTAGIVALAAHSIFKLEWASAMLLGAVVSSTDAATVFSVLRGSRLNLQKRVAVTLELESGMNDPMAVILTATLAEYLVGGHTSPWRILLEVPLQLTIGLVIGIVFGFVGATLLRGISLRAGGLYPVLTLAMAFLAFGVATLVDGSGFLAVYAAAVVIGNREIPYRHGLVRIHDAIAWLGQISMFLMLGLLVTPRQLLDVAPMGLVIGLILAAVARPVVTLLCLLPFGYSLRETLYIGWVGLRGAVPIILATIPVLASVPGSQELFNVVFFIVVVNALVPGATLRWVTRWLQLDVAEPPAPAAVLEINSMQLLKGEIMSFFIDDTLAVCNVSLAKVPFPSGAAAILVVRGNELLAAKGSTIITPGDHLYIFCRPEDRPHIQLLFGKPEE